MPRINMLREVFHMDGEDLLELYLKLGTIQKVADQLDVSTRSVRYWFKQHGIKGIKHTHHITRTPNEVRVWLDEHPKVKLPRSLLRIADIMDIKYSRVESYFYQRRKRVTNWIGALPPLTSLEKTVLRDTEGGYVPVKNIDTYDITVDLYSLKVSITGTRKSGGTFEVRLTARQYGQLFASGDIPDGLARGRSPT